MYKFNKKQIMWYLLTVCGFTLGFATGWCFPLYYDPKTPWQATWMELFFWVFPAGGAGFGMGLSQWLLIHRIYKNTYLWIIATTIGVIFIGGGALLIFAIINFYRMDALPWFYSQVPDWFVPLTIITPVIIFFGPYSQWLFVRYSSKSQNFKGFLKMSIGWITAIITLFTMFYIDATLFHNRNDALNLLVVSAATIPTGLIFAYSTITSIKEIEI